VSAIVAMAHALDLAVVAEGVETESQRAQLLDLGCIYGQGFAFARPGRVAEVEQLLALGILPRSGG
jgi:EAL domain-containing protein (putative c-di-GMP-specific phosphodiesterase class I)